MQTTSTNDQQPTRTVGVGELKTRADEIVREVRQTGRPVDIVQDGRVAARLSPVPTTDAADATSVQERERTVREWLRSMDEVSREIAAAWPKGVSAQDVIDDVRGPW